MSDGGERRERPKSEALTSGELIEVSLRSALDSFLDQPTRLREKETRVIKTRIASTASDAMSINSGATK